MPELFLSEDDNDVLKRLLAGFGDELDEIKSFVNQIPYSKHIDYGTQTEFLINLSHFLEQFGVNVFENAEEVVLKIV